MKSALLSLLVFVLAGFGCTSVPQALPPEAVRVSVYYPKKDGATFDWKYYTEQHLPLVERLLRPAMKDLVIEEGLGGGAKDAPAPFVAVAHMTFDSMASFQAAAGPHTAELMADIPHFTNIEPVIQVSRIRVGR